MLRRWLAPCVFILSLIHQNSYANPVLEVSVYQGDVLNERVVYDKEKIALLQQLTVRTKTPWTQGLQNFIGPRLGFFVERYKPSARKIIATAINGYYIEIPVSDVLEYDVILAAKRDGNDMSVRERGPYWVIYPWSEQPALRKETIYARSIWQVIKIELR